VGEFPREGDETVGQAAYRVQREKLDKFNNDFWVSLTFPFLLISPRHSVLFALPSSISTPLAEGSLSLVPSPTLISNDCLLSSRPPTTSVSLLLSRRRWPVYRRCRLHRLKRRKIGRRIG